MVLPLTAWISIPCCPEQYVPSEPSHGQNWKSVAVILFGVSETNSKKWRKYHYFTHVALVPVVLLLARGMYGQRARRSRASRRRELRRTFMIGCGDAKSNTLTQTATRATGVKAQPKAKRQAVVRTVDRELGERALGRLVPPIHPGEHDVVRLAVEVACAGAGGPGLELLKVPVIVMLLGLARRTARQIEKVPLSYCGPMNGMYICAQGYH